MPRDTRYDDDYAETPDDEAGDQPQGRDDDNDDRGRKPNWRRDLERKARERDDAQAAREKAEQAEAKARRELALIKAGVDVDSPTGKLFARAYDGEPTVDAVRAAAIEYGVVKPDVAPEEVAAEQRIAEAGVGGAPSGQGAPDPRAALDAIPEFTQDGRAFNPHAQEQVLQWAREQGLVIVNNAGEVGALQQAGPVTTPLT